jgi:flagellar biosynthesis/type III secretory pathway protein FliH
MKIRENQRRGMTLEEATDTACQYCIEHDILRNFLLKNRNEVTKVLLTEYNAKHQRKLDRRDAREEGLAEGRASGIAEGRASGLAEGRASGLAEGRATGLLDGEKAANTKVILHLLAKGKTPEEIHELLDYSMEEIERVSSGK